MLVTSILFLFRNSLNSLSNDKSLDWSTLKGLADDKINCTEKNEICAGKDIKRYRKKRSPACSTFPAMFSKLFFFKVDKTFRKALIYIIWLLNPFPHNDSF